MSVFLFLSSTLQFQNNFFKLDLQWNALSLQPALSIDLEDIFEGLMRFEIVGKDDVAVRCGGTAREPLSIGGPLDELDERLREALNSK